MNTKVKFLHPVFSILLVFSKRRSYCLQQVFSVTCIDNCSMEVGFSSIFGRRRSDSIPLQIFGIVFSWAVKADLHTDPSSMTHLCTRKRIERSENKKCVSQSRPGLKFEPWISILLHILLYIDDIVICQIFCVLFLELRKWPNTGKKIKSGTYHRKPFVKQEDY